MMTNAIGSTPSTAPSGATPTTTPTPGTGVQGQSTLGYGSTYGYNPYPSPYPTGLPGSSIASMTPYGYGGGGAMYGAGGSYGNTQYGGGYGYGNMMGNPYGGYQNSTGTGGLSSQTGLANGYGYESAVAPTVFQGALSGDGTLPSVHPGRIAQEFIGRENGEHKANAIGMGIGIGSGAMVYALTPRWFRSFGFRGVPKLLTAAAIGLAAGLTAKFASQPSLEKLSKNIALSEDYADNGHIDSSRLLQKNFEPDIKLFNNYI
jgi:hypothetical protein